MDGNFFADTNPLIAHVPPAGYSAGHGGIYIEIENKEGEVEREWLCSPLAVIALGSNAENTGWSRCVENIDPDGIAHRWYVPEKDLTIGFNRVLSGLRDRGLKLAVGAAARKHLSDLLNRWEPIDRYVITDHLGWADASCEAFVFGDKQVVGKANTVFLNEAAPDGAPEMQKRGTLAKWRKEVAARCQNNPILITSVSLAFAGPMLELLEKESAGLHLRGGSSSGKTTAMRAAVSVWGSPELMHSWRATANALEGIAATCNGSLLALDELGQVSGREVGDAIYTLSNGQGKARSSSSSKLQPKKKWRLMLLSTGEISLADKMAEAGKSPMAGQDVRLIDIAADTRRDGVFDDLHGDIDAASFANAMKRSTAETHGTAGASFVKFLIANRQHLEKFSSIISSYISALERSLGSCGDGPTKRVLGHFALIAPAGELATTAGITGWQKKDAVNAIFELAKAWHEAQGRSKEWQVEAAVDRTRAYLLVNGHTRFEEAGSAPLSGRSGYRDDKWFYILGDAWNAINAGHSPAEEAKHLIAGKWLIKGDGKNLQSKTPSWVVGRPRAYKIRADILNISSNGSTALNNV